MMAAEGGWWESKTEGNELEGVVMGEVDSLQSTVDRRGQEKESAEREWMADLEAAEETAGVEGVGGVELMLDGLHEG